MANFTAIFRLVAQTQGFNSTLQSAKAAIGGLGPKLGQGLKDQVGKVFSVKGALDMLKGTMEEVLNRAKQYNNLGMRMGLPAVEVQKLDRAAEAAGINVASLSRAMTLVQKFGGEAMSDTNKKTKILVTTLGASKEQLRVLASGGKEGLATLADMMSKIADSAERDYIGIKVLGEKWNELKPLIEQGGDAIRKAGEASATWGSVTQDSLTRTQKAWAGMWNDISVETANFLSDMEMVVGAVRILGNALMIIVRTIVLVVGGFFKAIQAVFWAIVSFINWIGVKLGGSQADLDETYKNMEKNIKDGSDMSEKFVENVGKDVKGMVKGAKQMAGVNTGDEQKLARQGTGTDTRSMEERQAYDDALEKQKEQALATSLSNAKEEEKLDILKQQLDLLKQQEDELKKKHPERYKETKDYLELQQKLEEQQRKINAQARKQDKDRYAAQVEAFELSNERRLKKMQAAGATEQEIYAETVRQQKENAVRLSEEYDALMKDKGASEEERRKKGMELAKAVAKTEDTIYAQQKKEKDASKGGPSVTSSSMRSFGGGGGVFIADTAAKQLMEAEETNQHLQDLIKISQNIAAGSVNAGTYSKPSINNP